MEAKDAEQEKVNYFIDTEFIELDYRSPVELMSIGIVADDNREFYAIALDGWHPDHASEWVWKNVIAKLGDVPRLPRAVIAGQIRALVGTDKATFWGYYADYDWLLFCQLFGTMLTLPKDWPHLCMDVKQFAMHLGNPRLPKQSAEGEHNALADARHIREMHRWLLKRMEAPQR